MSLGIYNQMLSLLFSVHLQPRGWQTRGSFHVSNHPRHASGFLPGSPSLWSISFCGEVGQDPRAGLENHESWISAASPTRPKESSGIQLWPHGALYLRLVPSGMCLWEAWEVSNTMKRVTDFFFSFSAWLQESPKVWSTPQLSRHRERPQSNCQAISMFYIWLAQGRERNRAPSGDIM